MLNCSHWVLYIILADRKDQDPENESLCQCNRSTFEDGTLRRNRIHLYVITFDVTRQLTELILPFSAMQILYRTTPESLCGTL